MGIMNKMQTYLALAGSLFLLPAESLWAAQTTAQQVVMNPFLNLLALSLIIERLLEIAVTLIPGIEEKKIDLVDDAVAFARFALRIKRWTLLAGMALGVAFCLFLRFGILDEIFTGVISPENGLNLVITGLIAGSGSDPVHHIIQLLISVREKLSASFRARRLPGKVS